MENVQQKQTIQWRILLPLLVILILDVMGFGLVIPLLKPLFFNLGTSILPLDTSENLRHLYYGLALALYPLAIVIGTPLLGLLSDRVGRKKVLFLSLISCSIALLICAIGIITTSISLLLFGRFIAGLSSSGRTIAQAAIADISTAKFKAIYLSLIAVALTIGMVMGPLFGGIFSNPNIVQHFTLATPFFLTAALFFIASLLFFKLFDETYDKSASKRWTLRQNIVQCFYIFKQLPVVVLLGVFMCLELAWSLYFQTSPLIMSRFFNYDATSIGLYTAFLGLSMSLGLLIVFRVILYYFSLLNAVLICALLSALGFIGIAITSNIQAHWLFAVPMTMGVGMTYTILLTLLSDRVGKDLQGWLMGLLGSLLALAWMLTGFLSSFLVAINPLAPLLLAAIIMLFASGLLCVTRIPGLFSVAKRPYV